jgi:hypothetical protein
MNCTTHSMSNNVVGSLVGSTGTSGWKTNETGNSADSVVPVLTTDKPGGWRRAASTFVGVISNGHGGHFVSRTAQTTGKNGNVTVCVVSGNVVAQFSGTNPGDVHLWSWYVVHGVIGGVIWLEHGTFSESVGWNAGWSRKAANEGDFVEFVDHASGVLAVVQASFEVVNFPLPHFGFEDGWSDNVLKHFSDEFWSAGEGVHDVVSGVLGGKGGSGMGELLVLEERGVR